MQFIENTKSSVIKFQCDQSGCLAEACFPDTPATEKSNNKTGYRHAQNMGTDCSHFSELGFAQRQILSRSKSFVFPECKNERSEIFAFYLLINPVACKNFAPPCPAYFRTPAGSFARIQSPDEFIRSIKNIKGKIFTKEIEECLQKEDDNFLIDKKIFSGLKFMRLTIDEEDEPDSKPILES